jgi:hypothetical protein
MMYAVDLIDEETAERVFLREAFLGFVTALDEILQSAASTI